MEQITRRKFSVPVDEGDVSRFFDRARQAVAAIPRDANKLGQLGLWLAWAGEWEEGLALVDRAFELSPFLPGWLHITHFARAYLDGDYHRGLEFAQKVDLPGWYWYHTFLAISYARLGQTAEAHEQAALVRETNPEFERAAYAEWRFWAWEEEAVEDFVAGLREAGLEIPPDGDGN